MKLAGLGGTNKNYLEIEKTKQNKIIIRKKSTKVDIRHKSYNLELKMGKYY